MEGVSMNEQSAIAKADALTPPFDAAKLDRLMEQHDLDAIIVNSKHNIRYLMGGYHFFFFSAMDAIGVSRYLPAFVYRRGRPELSFYAGCPLEKFEAQLDKFWTPKTQLHCFTSAETAAAVTAHLQALGGCRRVGIESAFLPTDAERMLSDGLGNVSLIDAQDTLDRLRAVKTPAEQALLKESSERVVQSMLAVFAGFGAGATKNDLNNALRLEETKRGLTFEYCLLTAGASHNRSPSDQRLEKGDVVSLDSGGNYHGYIGDLCRMGIIGEPDQELVDLLGEIEETQMAARKPIRAGAMGQEIYDHALAARARQKHAAITDFCAHGMGLVSHELPRLTGSGPVPYAGADAAKPLEAGMIISIETTLPHPKRGYVKLEDTVVVTKTGCEGYGDLGRGWNRMKS
jgi:Xaa-Pro aminopeptidase